MTRTYLEQYVCTHLIVVYVSRSIWAYYCTDVSLFDRCAYVIYASNRLADNVWVPISLG